MTWQNDAACRDHPHPDLWFPETGSTDTTEAQLICRRCPVQQACNENAAAVAKARAAS